jgi:diguanylate cyclase (GGDEF)-like protein
MPEPGEGSQPPFSSEESFLDLLAETLEGLDDSIRGSFLRQFFRTVAQVDLSEPQSSAYWKAILERRRELLEKGAKPFSLAAIIVDVLTSTKSLRVPVLIEYDDFKKLQINAATDALTGLYNRRLFDEYCDKELNRAKRYGHQLAVVILDVRKLKEVNDRHGHLRGDQILQVATRTLRTTLRSSDFAFRIGGDEFALLLPQTDSDQATTLCRRVRSQYETEVSPLMLEIGVTVDFGVAIYPEDGEKKDDLVSTADKRLYQLKAQGRFEPSPAAVEVQGERESAAGEQATRGTSPAPPPFPAPEPAPQVRVEPPPRPSIPISRPEQRKWERVSLAGTRAYAVLSDGGPKTARVIDLSYGGVSLSLEKPNEFPSQFNAVLHVPILPPVRVLLRQAYTMPWENGRIRMGCSFVS